MDLKELRQKQGLSEEQVAVALEVSSGTVRNWEAGRSIPTMTPEKMQKALGLYRCTLEVFNEAVIASRKEKMSEANQTYIKENRFYRRSNSINPSYHSGKKITTTTQWLLKKLTDSNVKEIQTQGYTTISIKQGRGTAYYDVFLEE